MKKKQFRFRDEGSFCGALTDDQKLISERSAVFLVPKRGKDDAIVINAYELH